MPARPIFYDTETTGIKAEREFIVEIAAYDPVEERTFDKLVNPGVPIPKEASRVHNITDDMVAEAPPFTTIGPEFVEFCQGDTVLIAHNNDSFDVLFLRAEFKRNNLEMPPWNFLDSLKWARRYRPDLPKHSLQFLRDTYGISENNAHRALDDVIVLHQIWSAMTDDLTIEQIHSLLNAPRTINRMPFGKHKDEPLENIPSSYIRWLAEQGAFDKPGNEELRLSFEKLGKLEPQMVSS